METDIKVCLWWCFQRGLTESGPPRTWVAPSHELGKVCTSFLFCLLPHRRHNMTNCLRFCCHDSKSHKMHYTLKLNQNKPFVPYTSIVGCLVLAIYWIYFISLSPITLILPVPQSLAPSFFLWNFRVENVDTRRNLFCACWTATTKSCLFGGPYKLPR